MTAGHAARRAPLPLPAQANLARPSRYGVHLDMSLNDTQSRPITLADRMAYRVKEAAELLAISRSRFYELIADGQIRVLKEGARTLVRKTELEAYLDRLETAPAPARSNPPKRRRASTLGPPPRS